MSVTRAAVSLGKTETCGKDAFGLNKNSQSCWGLDSEASIEKWNVHVHLYLKSSLGNEAWIAHRTSCP